MRLEGEKKEPNPGACGDTHNLPATRRAEGQWLRILMESYPSCEPPFDWRGSRPRKGVSCILARCRTSRSPNSAERCRLHSRELGWLRTLLGTRWPRRCGSSRARPWANILSNEALLHVGTQCAMVTIAGVLFSAETCSTTIASFRRAWCSACASSTSSLLTYGRRCGGRFV